MKRMWTTLALVAMPALGITALAGTPATGDDSPQPQATKADSGNDSSDKIESLIRDLGHEDYVVRDRAYDSLRKMGAAAKPELEKATKNEDPEIRWRAGRLLRALASGESDEAQSDDSKNGGRADAKPTRRSLRRQDLDSDRGRQDGSNDSDPGMGDWPGMDEGFRRNMQDLQRQMRDMEREMNRLMQQHGQGGMSQSLQGNGTRSTLRMDENGVEATVTELENGKEVTHTYQAKDLDDFKAKYPDVAAKLGLDRMQFRFQTPFGNGNPTFRVPRPQAQPFTPTPPQRDDSDGPRLGVVVGSPTPDLAEHLGLEEGQGLIVKEVVPDSLASRLGIQKSDVILEVAGKSVGSSDDVRSALESAKPGSTVKVKILRHGEEKTLSAKRADDEGSGR
jgi:PDZ domain-containing protein